MIKRPAIYILGASEVSVNLYCNSRKSVLGRLRDYLRLLMGHPVYLPYKSGKSGKSNIKQTKGTILVACRSARAGLQFPVGRIHRHLKSRTVTNLLYWPIRNVNIF